MDNVTHALAGCLLAAATVTLARRRSIALPRHFVSVATTVGIITAELPDADLLYAGQALGIGKLGYLLHHRGHTHTVVFAVGAALLVWLAVLAFRRETRAPAVRSLLLALALGGTFSHLALDFSNSYGVHPFWPVVNEWYYGDAVFIVEPWLWLAAIPALLFTYESRVARAVLALLLAGILLAAWISGFVAPAIAVAMTVFAVVWLLVARGAAPGPRPVYAVAAWLAIEAVFFGASYTARRSVRNAVGAAALRDVALTPFVGSPLCFSALVVEETAGIYSASNAVVAVLPGVQDAEHCVGRAGSVVPGSGISRHASTTAVRWSGAWTAPVSELVHLFTDNCEVAAALQFIRVPVWRELGDGTVEIADVRFGAGVGGFSNFTVSRNPVSCPRFIPGWTPPRSDVLRPAATR